jgi:hypothetical protein
MTSPEKIDVDTLINDSANSAALGYQDPLSYLRGSRVWILSGSKDSIVVSGVSDKLKEFYLKATKQSEGDWMETHIRDLDAEHSFVTKSTGNSCDYLGSPYINNCNFDAAGSLLTHLYSTTRPLSPPSSSTDWSKKGQLISFDQGTYLPLLVVPSAVSMSSSAVIYVPDACKADSATENCRLHFAYHGCDQTMADIGDSYIKDTGYLEWAAENNIVVVFPQTVRSNTIPVNPKGCWDWWGYTGTAYASNIAPQLQFFKNVIDSLVSQHDFPSQENRTQANKIYSKA